MKLWEGNQLWCQGLWGGGWQAAGLAPLGQVLKPGPERGAAGIPGSQHRCFCWAILGEREGEIWEVDSRREQAGEAASYDMKWVTGPVTSGWFRWLQSLWMAVKVHFGAWVRRCCRGIWRQEKTPGGASIELQWQGSGGFKSCCVFSHPHHAGYQTLWLLLLF